MKISKSYRHVAALCDKELIGKLFEEEKFQLDVKESFYKGEEITKEKAIKVLQDMAIEDATFNIVGKKSIQTAIEAGIIEKDSVGQIKGIPYALVLI